MSKQSKTRGINHILNYNRKENALKPELANVYYDTDNKGNNVQVACDGFRLAVLKDFAEVKNIEMENAKNIPYEYREVTERLKKGVFLNGYNNSVDNTFKYVNE